MRTNEAVTGPVPTLSSSILMIHSEVRTRGYITDFLMHGAVAGDIHIEVSYILLAVSVSKLYCNGAVKNVRTFI